MGNHDHACKLVPRLQEGVQWNRRPLKRRMQRRAPPDPLRTDARPMHARHALDVNEKRASRLAAGTGTKRADPPRGVSKVRRRVPAEPEEHLPTMHERSHRITRR
mmetsp:Transcript_23660/g.72326  ORF Transcript_23660/g.72326 Transcript_23660/m.72326 type:complete len:105 (+) Transcript_23660:212-526(+)|eukprot:scaffold185184_cov29-Tisochrysis_lutea.AAC.3